MTLNKDSEKDKIIRKDFKIAQYVYISICVALIISLIVLYK